MFHVKHQYFRHFLNSARFKKSQATPPANFAQTQNKSHFWNSKNKPSAALLVRTVRGFLQESRLSPLLKRSELQRTQKGG